jgi:hypothetical protein
MVAATRSGAEIRRISTAPGTIKPGRPWPAGANRHRGDLSGQYDLIMKEGHMVKTSSERPRCGEDAAQQPEQDALVATAGSDR